MITKREIHLQTGKEVNKSGKFVYKMGLLDYKRNRWGENGILGLQMGILFCNSPKHKVQAIYRAYLVYKLMIKLSIIKHY